MSTQLTGLRCAAPMAMPLAPRGSELRRASSASDAAILMKNADFQMPDDIFLEIRALCGILNPARAGEPVTFNGAGSFEVIADTAETAVSPESLGAWMNSCIVGYKGSPIRNVGVELEGGRIKQKRTLRKGIGIGFEIEGSLGASDGADLEIAGGRPDPFDFFQKQYRRQLVAGYSKGTASNGLIAHMADHSRFRGRER